MKVSVKWSFNGSFEKTIIYACFYVFLRRVIILENERLWWSIVLIIFPYSFMKMKLKEYNWFNWSQRRNKFRICLCKKIPFFIWLFLFYLISFFDNFYEPPDHSNFWPLYLLLPTVVLGRHSKIWEDISIFHCFKLINTLVHKEIYKQWRCFNFIC